MSAVHDQVRKVIAEARLEGEVRRVEVTQDVLDELGPEFDGVEVVLVNPRDESLGLAVIYARLRWNINLTNDDAASLFKAVGDDELWPLVQIIVDQHMDDHGFEDPADMLPEAVVRRLGEELEGLGFENPFE